MLQCRVYGRKSTGMRSAWNGSRDSTRQTNELRGRRTRISRINHPCRYLSTRKFSTSRGIRRIMVIPCIMEPTEWLADEQTSHDSCNHSMTVSFALRGRDHRDDYWFFDDLKKIKKNGTNNESMERRFSIDNIVEDISRISAFARDLLRLAQPARGWWTGVSEFRKDEVARRSVGSVAEDTVCSSRWNFAHVPLSRSLQAGKGRTPEKSGTVEVRFYKESLASPRPSKEVGERWRRRRRAR